MIFLTQNVPKTYCKINLVYLVLCSTLYSIYQKGNRLFSLKGGASSPTAILSFIVTFIHISVSGSHTVLALSPLTFSWLLPSCADITSFEALFSRVWYWFDLGWVTLCGIWQKHHWHHCCSSLLSLQQQTSPNFTRTTKCHPLQSTFRHLLWTTNLCLDNNF